MRKTPSWVVFAAAFALYAGTAATTVQGGDTGELALVALRGGVPHPPGYPLQAVLGRVAASIPLGDPFLRVSLLSAFAGALGAALLQRVLASLAGSEEAGAWTALFFAISPLAWGLAGVPEVFALSVVLAAFVLGASLRLSQGNALTIGPRAFELGLALGLAMSNHHTAVLLVPIVLWALASTWKTAGDERRRIAGLLAIRLLAGGMLGLLPYLYLPVAAASAGDAAWVWGDTVTPWGLLRHVSRSDYGTFRLGVAGVERSPAGEILRSLGALPRAWAYLPFLAGALGVATLAGRRRGLLAAIIGSLLLAAVVFPALFNLPATEEARAVAGRFYLLPALLWSMPVAVGLAAIEGRVPRMAKRAVLASTFLVAAACTRPSVDWRSQRLIETYLVRSIEGVVEGAVVLGQGDLETFGFGWVLRGRRFRPDVTYVDIHLLRYRWYYEDVRRRIPAFEVPFDAEVTKLGAIIRDLRADVPLYATMSVVTAIDASSEAWPEGFLARIAPPGSKRPPLEELEAHLASDTAALPGRPPLDAWGRYVRRSAAVPWKVLADQWRAAGSDASAERAEARMRAVLAIDRP